MKHFKNLVFIIFILLLSCSGEPPQPVKFLGETQGTYYAVTYYDDDQRNFQDEVDRLLKDFDMTASAWVPTSLISRINNNDGEVVLNDDFIEIFNMGMDVNRRSKGAFDMTVGPLVRLWGFGPEGPLKPDTTAIDSLLMLVGQDKIQIKDNRLIKADPEVRMDFNAIAQGYSVDLLGEFLESKGITSYIVDIGGEVLAKGKKADGSSWKVGIEKPARHPRDERTLQSIVSLHDKALATSGNYRKFYEKDGIRYSHTIDPSTGYPVGHSLLSVSVLAESACIADAWATAFMVMGQDNSRELVESNPDLDIYLIYTNDEGEMEVWYSEGFKEVIEE